MNGVMVARPASDVLAPRIPVRNLWHMFVYAWNLFILKPKFKAAVDRAPNALLLFASLLATCLEHRARRGAPRDYVRTDGELGVIRGQIDIARSVRGQTFERGRIHCRYDTYSLDTPRNRTIKMTVRQLVGTPELRNVNGEGSEIRARLLHCLKDMAEVGVAPIRRDAFRRECFGRNDGEDALILAICELLFLTCMPTTFGGAHRLMEADRNEVLLRKVFEHFVWRFLDRRLTRSGWRVEHGKILQWPVLSESPGLRGYLPDMWFDLRLTSADGKRVIILDTKFKNIVTRGQYGTERFASANLYQIFTYTHSQIAFPNPPTEAVLLYPAIDRKVSEFVQLPAVKLRFETIDLGLPWLEVEDALVKLF